MRLASYLGPDGSARSAVLLDGPPEQLLDVKKACEALGASAPLDGEIESDMISLLATGPEGLDALREVAERAANRSDLLVPLDGAKLLAPVPRPPRLRDYLTYAGHADNSDFRLGDAFYQMPIGYDGNVNSVIGPDDELSWPPFSDQLDYELEIALIIGKAGRDLSVEAAGDHIAGFTLLNDVSARDIQGFEMTMLLGPNKGKHFCNAMGPTIATLDGLDEYALEAKARINGETWSSGTSKNREYSFAEVVAWASWGEDLQPGEVIGLGTVEGGCGVEIDRWIKSGDQVEFELTRVGVLRNRVGAKQDTPGAGIPSFDKAPPFAVPKLPGAAD